MTPSKMLRRCWPEVLILLVFMASRGAALTALPLHNDEGLHLTRAVEVWNLKPFFAIEDGKVINSWLIALFYPQHAPDYVGRIATVFVGLIGIAAGMALARRATRSRSAGLLAGMIWLVGPYLFFFERMAFADVEAGAMAVLLALFALPGGRKRSSAVGAGVALGAAVLFKVSAAPFAGIPILAMLLERGLTWRKRVIRLLIIFGVALVLFLPAGVYSAIRGGFFSIARGWVGGPRLSLAERAAQNMNTLLDTTLTVDGLWALLLLGVQLTVLGRRRGMYVLGSAIGPLAVTILFGTEVMDRHYGPLMPLLAVAAAVGWLEVSRWVMGKTSPPPPRSAYRERGATQNTSASSFMRGGVVAICVIAVVVVWFTRWRIAYSDPAAFPMTAPMLEQYVSAHPAGYGLREAVQAFPQTVGDSVVIGSMTPDGCKRARFYLADGTKMECYGPAQGEISEALQTSGRVYVLAEDPPVGLAPSSVPGNWQKIAAYPRPRGQSTITLWRITR